VNKTKLVHRELQSLVHPKKTTDCSQKTEKQLTQTQVGIRNVLITGGSGGLGGGMVCRFAEGGDKVAIHYNGNRDKALAIAATLPNQDHVMVVQADLTSATQVERMMTEVTDRWGGIHRDTLFMRMSEEDWDAVITTNLRSAYLCSKAVTRTMMGQRYGRILNVSSVVGVTGNAGQANYAAAKAGMIGFTRSLAKELAKRGVTVNAIAPGFIDAGMTVGLSQEVHDKAMELIPLGRFGSVVDVAEAAWFLCSNAAGYITGQVLQVDGGMVIA
jgi:3-oxoacyl-[acyl-carrier protein] reductase